MKRPASQVYLIPDEHTHYPVDLTGGPDQLYLSGLPDGEWLALVISNGQLS
jgi:hypothetical protein